jgi:hypothetical protein
MNEYAQNELQSEWDARADYISELAAEHVDPAAGFEDGAYEDDAAAEAQAEAEVVRGARWDIETACCKLADADDEKAAWAIRAVLDAMNASPQPPSLSSPGSKLYSAVFVAVYEATQSRLYQG